jgi:drug/metabolite transporter (DMT)-like permease
VSADFVLWQILVLRSIIAIPILVLICIFRQDTISLFLNIKGCTFTRSILMISMWITYYGALIYLHTTVEASVYYTMPIFLTLLAAILIRETITSIG